jgi:quaternary ammonium compound-resistance protein SugE
MPWLVLVMAGIFEVGYATFLKLSNSFTALVPTLLFATFAVASFSLLAFAAKRIPLGTAYAVWTGIGAFGTGLVGIVFFDDPVNVGRIIFLSLIVVAVVGLKLVSPDKEKA